ncbi:hypothetical protein [Limisphaera sp. 4302-co]|uniref:hypothetical protein n=1 Tax=Limisphaera sp. 4302-co TaxID=3400417 RepID=UPI003C2137BA
MAECGAGASAPAAAVFPPEYDAGWIKQHGRLVRWRIQTVVARPEEIGLCGYWLLMLVRRDQQHLRRGRVIRRSVEYAWHCSSAAWGKRLSAAPGFSGGSLIGVYGTLGHLWPAQMKWP